MQYRFVVKFWDTRYIIGDEKKSLFVARFVTLVNQYFSLFCDWTMLTSLTALKYHLYCMYKKS